MRLEDLRPKRSEPERSEFVKELIGVLPYSEIPHSFHAQEVIDFFVEHGWTPPPDEVTG